MSTSTFRIFDGAFPHDRNNPVTAGLSKRELFAAMAMQGICANSEDSLRIDEIAKLAVCCANALIEELKK